MDKEFIPYEQAIALKELGFDEPCLIWADKQGNISYDGTTKYGVNYNKNFELVSIPIYQQVFRWFRENHNLHGYFNA